MTCPFTNLTLFNSLMIILLGKIFGPEGDKQICEWRNMHNVELYNPYENADIIRTLKSRRLH